MTPRRIISGGQTGVDRGALDAAMDLGLEQGGFCPKGRRAEDGRIPHTYALREHESQNYTARTVANVEAADATLILTRGQLSGGSAFTLRAAWAKGKPRLVVDLAAGLLPLAADQVRNWLSINAFSVLNVAGPRESRCPGIGWEARAVLLDALDGAVPHGPARAALGRVQAERHHGRGGVPFPVGTKQWLCWRDDMRAELWAASVNDVLITDRRSEIWGWVGVVVHPSHQDLLDEWLGNPLSVERFVARLGQHGRLV